MTEKNVTVVMGGQYGSEGKGVIVSKIANRFLHHVRVGGPNAGHTIMHLGKKWKMQIVPCGWMNPNAKVWLGRGILIDVEHLVQEIEEIRAVDPTITNRLFIDRKAGILSPSHKADEGGVDGDFHFAIGSTGEGVGSARLARVGRTKIGGFHHAFQIPELGVYQELVEDLPWDWTDLLVDDTPKRLNEANERGEKILLEGTQGSGLSLIHGPEWPYATSTDTNACQMLADVGFSPLVVEDIIMVVRTYPIRVWGNSGPMYKETDFDQLSEKLGKKVIERTTVTKKVRRISEWDPPLFEHALVLNKPTQIAITFLDYLDMANEGKDNINDLTDETIKFIERVQETSGCPVTFLCTGWSEEKKNWVVIEAE
jgi:adenylosuccinate synthase